MTQRSPEKDQSAQHAPYRHLSIKGEIPWLRMGTATLRNRYRLEMRFNGLNHISS